MIAVLHAAKAGMQIQVRTHSGMDWQDIECDGPLWNFHLQDYRVKPQPREWTVPVHVLRGCMSYDVAKDTEIVTVREVLGG